MIETLKSLLGKYSDLNCEINNIMVDVLLNNNGVIERKKREFFDNEWTSDDVIITVPNGDYSETIRIELLTLDENNDITVTGSYANECSEDKFFCCDINEGIIYWCLMFIINNLDND